MKLERIVTLWNVGVLIRVIFWLSEHLENGEVKTSALYVQCSSPFWALNPCLQHSFNVSFTDVRYQWNVTFTFCWTCIFCAKKSVFSLPDRLCCTVLTASVADRSIVSYTSFWWTMYIIYLCNRCNRSFIRRCFTHITMSKNISFCSIF